MEVWMPSKLDVYLYDETKPAQRLKIACTAAACARDVGENRARMASTIGAIVKAHPDVELIVWGEMILGWYVPHGPPGSVRPISEPVPGETTQALAALARKHGLYLCFGLSELDGGALYNAQVLLNPQGEIQAVHRKRNLKPGERSAGYQPGSARVTVAEIKGVRTGLVICSDTADLKTIWALMRGRFDLILHSLADDDQDDFVTLFQARMYDAWFVTANRYGREGGHFWPGLITVTDPLGRVRGKKLGQEQVLVYELRFAEPGPWFKRILRNTWIKAPVIAHVIVNWKQAKSYL
jgi:predicted amidohydrolase